MRCATCGTENAPDSRFCGGCGARTAPSNVAPTQKISDDAPIAPPTYPSYAAQQQPYAGPPGNHGPPSMPPPSIPPTNNPYVSTSSAPQYQSVPPQPSPYAATAANPASIPPNQVFASPPGTGSIPPTRSPYAAPPGNGSIPPNTYQAPPGTGSIPPTSRAPTGPVAEQNPATAQRRASAAVRAPSPAPSLSMPKKRGTRWGIVLFILAIDIGLAATGAYFLQAGL